MKKAGAGWLRRKNLKDNGLEFHFATEGAENADQSGAEQQQRGGLRSSAATATKNVECTLRLDAVAIPSQAAVGGVLIDTSRTVAEVPRFPSARGGIGWSDDHPVIGAGGEAESRNTGDGDQAAALSEGCAAGQVGEHGQLRTRSTVVIGVNRYVEGVGSFHQANPDIDLPNAATCRDLELVG